MLHCISSTLQLLDKGEITRVNCKAKHLHFQDSEPHHPKDKTLVLADITVQGLSTKLYILCYHHYMSKFTL